MRQNTNVSSSRRNAQSLGQKSLELVKQFGSVFEEYLYLGINLRLQRRLATVKLWEFATYIFQIPLILLVGLEYLQELLIRVRIIRKASLNLVQVLDRMVKLSLRFLHS